MGEGVEQSTIASLSLDSTRLPRLSVRREVYSSPIHHVQSLVTQAGFEPAMSMAPDIQYLTTNATLPRSLLRIRI